MLYFPILLSPSCLPLFFSFLFTLSAPLFTLTFPTQGGHNTENNKGRGGFRTHCFSAHGMADNATMMIFLSFSHLTSYSPPSPVSKHLVYVCVCGWVWVWVWVCVCVCGCVCVCVCACVCVCECVFYFNGWARRWGCQ
jgi:hypothetical protein